MNDQKRETSEFVLEFMGPEGREQIPLGERPVSVGRHSTNTIFIQAGLASRFHCLIWVKQGKAWVKDLNSSNGTFVNGNPVTTLELSLRDIIKVGDTQILFTSASDTSPTMLLPRITKPRFGAAPLIEDIVPPAPIDLELADDLTILDDSAAAPPDLSWLEQAASLDRAPVDFLNDPDVVELGPEDVIEDEEDPASTPVAAWSRSLKELPPDNAGPIPLVESAGVSSGEYDCDGDAILAELAASLPDQAFAAADIALLNARGQVVHPAGGAGRRGEAVDLFRRLLLVAARGRATDIHVEPREGGFQIRMRVDGTMVDVVRAPTAMGIRVSALVKVLAEIDLAERNSIQEGHFSSVVPSDRPGATRKIDFRVSFAPSVFGQKLVMRILDSSYAPMHVRALCLPDWMQDEVARALRKNSGMLLVCGPTGSGKTTTLYALVRGSDVQRRNVITIEDPVEIQLESVTQIPVDEAHDRGFASLLRSILRQDPDVIMIGEIRDAETARIAMQAAITGHLVFSTIHTRDTAGTIFRLLDLGVEPYLVVQALHLVLAQRLVRQLCPHCKAGYAPTREELDAMGDMANGVSLVFRPVGCPKCLGTGYRGRRAFFELLTANDALRDAIIKQPTLQSVREALRPTRFQSLQHSGYQLVVEGAVAFSEIERIIGQLND